MLTNVHKLPQALVDAVLNDRYSRGDSDISVTQLIQPPQIRHLLKTNEPVEDVAERVWSLWGSSLHHIIERGYEHRPEVEQEVRLFTTCNGWRVSGAFDVFDPATGTISDWKSSSVYSRDGKESWNQQLNLLRVLAVRNGRDVRELQVIALFRDWMKIKAKTESDYPPAQVEALPVEMWPLEKAEAFLEERVRIHQAADAGNVAPCSDEDRWATEEVFALMKDGRKSAVKLYKVEAAAKAAAGDDKKLSVQHRPKHFKRCNNYCSMVHVCPQVAAEQADRPF